jgi:YD repeat-containing protein
LYDGGGRLTRLENKKSGGTVISTFDYLYDNAGNRTKVTEDSGSVVEFRYDATYRLTYEKRNTQNV